jgi:pimeloyl-ACP methyl ester carboxylesterase
MLVGLASPARSDSELPVADRDTVVLLHGLGRTRLSMNRMAKRLQKQGYEVMNIGYRSTRHGVAELAGRLHQELQTRRADGASRIHFVTHSFGGIVVRAYLKEYRPSNLGRVVMLSPPNQGSELADRFRNNWFYRAFAGPSGQELGTQHSSTPNALGAVDFPLGVIAGDRSLNPLFSAWIPGPDDGVVSVSRARTEGMSDFLVVPRIHTFIMRSSKVTGQVVHFLENGEFARPST